MLDPTLLLSLPGDLAGALLLADFAPPEDFLRLVSLAALLAIGLRSALALAGARAASVIVPGTGTGIAVIRPTTAARNGSHRSLRGAGAIAAP